MVDFQRIKNRGIIQRWAESDSNISPEELVEGLRMVNLPSQPNPPESPKVEEWRSHGVCPTCKAVVEKQSRSTIPLQTAVRAICPKCQNGMIVENEPI